MKKRTNYLIAGVLFLLLTSCGISKEVRIASITLVEKQKTSLQAHQNFHNSVVNTINNYLGAEEQRTNDTYKNSIKINNESLIDEIKTIYSDQSTNIAQKKVKEEEIRQEIDGYIAESKQYFVTKKGYITKAQENLNSASQNILKAEENKTLAIEKIDKYLQMKRPSERLLDLINIDLENYTKYVDNANSAIQQVTPYLDKLKK
tara:strand:+ start:62 stop:673 length:612 start_codon:yes stop_codon:yes gene_type:complete